MYQVFPLDKNESPQKFALHRGIRQVDLSTACFKLLLSPQFGFALCFFNDVTTSGESRLTLKYPNKNAMSLTG